MLAFAAYTVPRNRSRPKNATSAANVAPRNPDREKTSFRRSPPDVTDTTVRKRRSGNSPPGHSPSEQDGRVRMKKNAAKTDRKKPIRETISATPAPARKNILRTNMTTGRQRAHALVPPGRGLSSEYFSNRNKKTDGKTSVRNEHRQSAYGRDANIPPLCFDQSHRGRIPAAFR